MKRRIIAGNTLHEGFEYIDNLPDIVTILDEVKNDGSWDTWGDVSIYGDKIGYEYNLCLNATEDGAFDDCSAFYKMYYNPDTGVWADDTSFVEYTIDFDNPDWRLELKQFAYNLLIDALWEDGEYLI